VQDSYVGSSLSSQGQGGDVNRRGFLAGLAGLAVAPLLPKLPDPEPLDIKVVVPLNDYRFTRKVSFHWCLVQRGEDFIAVNAVTGERFSSSDGVTWS
jgi:hypothetical protein